MPNFRYKLSYGPAGTFAICAHGIQLDMYIMYMLRRGIRPEDLKIELEVIND